MSAINIIILYETSAFRNVLTIGGIGLYLRYGLGLTIVGTKRSRTSMYYGVNAFKIEQLIRKRLIPTRYKTVQFTFLINIKNLLME